MKDSSKTIQELIKEISVLKKRTQKLECSEAESKRSGQEMAILSNIGRLIDSTLEIDEIYEQFAAEAKKLILFDSLTINLCNFQENTLCVAYVSGFGINGLRQGNTLVMEGSLSEAVIRAQTSFLIQPASTDEIIGLFPRLFPIFQAGIRSIMCIPLVSRDEVIGVLLFRSKNQNAYTKQDLHLAEKITMQISGAIANAQLFADLKKAKEEQRRNRENAEQLADEIALIAEIGQIISSTVNIEEVYERFAEEMRKLIPFDRIVINFINVEMNTVTTLYTIGAGIADRKIGASYPLKGSGSFEMVRTRSSLLLQSEDFDKYKDRLPSLVSTFQAGFRSIMNIPLFSKGEIIGGLLLRSLKPGAYTDRDVRLAEKVGHQIAGAIANTQLYKELKETDKSLRLSEERFRRIFDEGPVGMVLVSPDDTIISANKVFCELLGYTEQELAGHTVVDITSEEDKEKSRMLSGQLFAGSIPMYRLEKRFVRKDGEIAWTNLTASAIHGKKDQVVYAINIIEDLTESRRAIEKIHLLSYYDSLTGLPNRAFFKELMKRAIDQANRRKEIFALIYIGLDNFQRINDTLGHNSGDLLLKAVAERLIKSLRRSDCIGRSENDDETSNVVSRVGGDEFIILAHDLKQPQDAATASYRLLREISEPFDPDGYEVFLTASIGIALYPDNGADVDDLLKNADTALEHAKKECRGTYQFYSRSMNQSVLELLMLENGLRKALERNELVLFYQPKVDAVTRVVTGMEALIRWEHPDKGLIPPMQFIPLAETSGLILPIGEYVIRTVCRQIKTWQEAGNKQISISLNVSSRQFDQQNLIEIVKESLQDTMIPSQCLQLEITESTIIRNPEKAIRTLTELKAMGIGIAIDDFGTGYSSLSYLKRLPLDFLKIDMSFIKNLVSDPNDQTIVKAIVAMAHSLNLKTIAEGVEMEMQLSLLQKYGCDEIQGYLFSRPLPADEITKILAKGCL